MFSKNVNVGGDGLTSYFLPCSTVDTLIIFPISLPKATILPPVPEDVIDNFGKL